MPPDVVAGTVTNKYVPSLNGVSSVTMPLNDFVHAVSPLAACCPFCAAICCVGVFEEGYAWLIPGV